MQHHLSDYDADYMDDDNQRDYQLRKPNHSRRRLEEYMEQKRLKRYLEEDYDYDLDD